MPAERILTAAQAIREALDIALQRWPESYLMGLGVADPGGVFGTTKGLVDVYGPERVVEMPVAENGLTGIAIGTALAGQRPIMSHQRVEFALLSLEQIYNAAAKSHYVTNGAHAVPLTIRMIIGRGWGQGPQHSQALETLFAYMPGLKVAMPSTPAEFKGLLLGAIADNNPVIFLEHRWLHYATGHVPEGYYEIPLTGPRTAKPGSDVTIVANSYMLLEALRAAGVLSTLGCDAEVIDLRVLRPLNLAPIEASLRRTGRLIACDTGWRAFGPSAEVVSTLVENAFDAFRRPPVRIGLPDHPTPSSVAFAASYYPGSVDIIRAAGRLCDLDAQAVDDACAQVIEERQRVPIDTPDPAFRGPF